MENYEDDDDTHFCIKCHATISGLENYVRHRQAGCCRLGEKEVVVQGVENAPSTVSYPEVPNADAFFNSLELQSSAKKPPRRAARAKTDRGRKDERLSEARKKPRRCQTEPEDVASKTLGPSKLSIISVDAELDNPTDHLSIPSLVGFPDIVSSSTSKPAVTVSSSKNCATPLLMKIEPTNYAPKQDPPLESSLETFMADESVPKSGPSSKRREVWLGDNILEDHRLGADAESKGIAHSSSLSRYADYDFVDDVESDDDCNLDEDMVDDDSCSETDDANDPEYPPQGHTGGKWRPGLSSVNQVETELVEDEVEPDEDNPERPPPSHTGGKWKPTENSDGQRVDDVDVKDEKDAASQPPPSHTRGKWVPGARSDQSSGFYCSPCGRRLASRLVYNRHLLSELHAKRSIKELDGVLRLPRGVDSLGLKDSGGTLRRRVATWKVQENEELRSSEGKKRSRNRRREIIWCEMCRTRVRRPQMGKHLLSHYHCRVAGVIPRSPKARAFLLNNMANVVRQCPFQCAGCHFYCNTEDTFLLHWRSEFHTMAHREMSGSYRCTACDYWCENNDEMENHVTSFGHRQVVSMMNGSVPVVITRQRRLPCDTCGQDFRYNIQLKQHVSETGHAAETASDMYQSRIWCPQCSQVFRSLIALQRHQLATHVKEEPSGKLSSTAEPYFCSTCSLNFPSAEEAVRHRKTPRHKELVEDRKNELRGVKRQRKCPNCDLALPDLQQLKQHLLQTHVELCHRCPRCGETFPLPQDLALHTRKGECVQGEILKSRSESVDDHEDLEVGEEAEEEEEAEEVDVRETECSQVGSASFRCNQCVYVTNSQAEFIYHETLHVTSESSEGTAAKIRPNFQCPVCQKSFKKQHYLIRHIRMHTGEKPFPCPSCKTHFATRAKLNIHITNCTNASASWVDETGRHRNYVCLQCKNAFYTKHALQQHMLRHTGKKFLCGLPGCPTALRTPGELRTHRDRIHNVCNTGKRHQCPECNYQAVSTVQLKRHQKQQHRHPGEGTSGEGNNREDVADLAGEDAGAGGFRCPYTDCHFKSKLKSHLRRHLRLHTGSKPYRCAHCSYASNNFENLRKHVLSTKIHPGKSIYECTHCDTYRTNFSRELRAHLIQDHRDNFPTAEIAANHVAGIYSADNQPNPSTIIDDPSSLQSCRIFLIKNDNV